MRLGLHSYFKHWLIKYVRRKGMDETLHNIIQVLSCLGKHLNISTIIGLAKMAVFEGIVYMQ